MPERAHDGWRAHVEPDYVRGGVKVLLARRLYSGHVEYVDRSPGELLGGTVRIGDVDAATELPPSAWLYLPGEQGRALLDALTEFYGQPQAADTELLREMVTMAVGHGDRTQGTLERVLDLLGQQLAPPLPPALAAIEQPGPVPGDPGWGGAVQGDPR